VRPRLAHANTLGLELANGARLSSLPSRPPRGRARTNVYLDEFAHATYDKGIYTAALPVISKGGRLRIGSSPLGAAGVFWEIFSQKLRPYPGYTRKLTPWWEIFAFCINVPEARREAAMLTSTERVARFGNARIREIFENLPEEDFRQEFEGAFVDESTAWITWEEIRAAQEQGANLKCVMAKGPDKVEAAVLQLLAYIRQGQCETTLYGGMDIGRTRNTTEIYLVGAGENLFPLRFALTLDGVDYDTQFDALSQVLAKLPIAKLLIDCTGLGGQLAENAVKRFPMTAEGALFSLKSKTLWATDAKMLIQQHKTPLPTDRNMAYQIHSIKRIVTPSKNLVFDTDANEKHHADAFWAWALALAALRMGPTSVSSGTLPDVLGDYVGVTVSEEKKMTAFERIRAIIEGRA